MTRPDEIMLMSYADGELSPEDAAAVEAYLATAPEDAARIERMRAARLRLKRAYGSVSDEEAPERLSSMLAGPDAESQIVDLTAKRAAREARRWAGPHLAAMAASLAAGFVIALQFAAPKETLVAESGGALVASAALDKALTGQAAAQQGRIAIGMTFRDENALWCRTFAAEAIAGLACRTDGAWSIRVLTSPNANDDGGYRMAASATAPAILAAVEARIDGEPLDAEEEAAALASGWRD